VRWKVREERCASASASAWKKWTVENAYKIPYSCKLMGSHARTPRSPLFPYLFVSTFQLPALSLLLLLWRSLIGLLACLAVEPS